MAATRWIAKRPMQYGPRQMDRGEIFEPKGERNDEKLLRLGYVRVLKKADPVATCGTCQRQFCGDGERDAHAKFQHRTLARLADPVAREQALEEHLEKEEKLAEELNPLRLDRTAATLAGRGGRR